MKTASEIEQEKGFALIEVVIALAIVAIIASGFLIALSTTSKAIFLADERTTAESLARSQMEYIKSQDYIPVLIEGEAPYEASYQKIADVDIPANYTIWSIDYANDPVEIPLYVYGVPWDSQNNIAVDPDVGLQRIKLVIKHYDKDIITLEGYKVYR